jgi:signal transduction histidine kinase
VRAGSWLASLTARASLLLTLLFASQALLAGLAVSVWMRSRELNRHQVELREQAALLLPAIEDSLARWAGSGPLISRQAELRHRMQLSLGRPQAMSLVWLDQSGNMAAAGFLAEDRRLPELKELALAGLPGPALESWARRQNLALVVQPAAGGWLVLAGSSSAFYWDEASERMLAGVLAGSAVIAGLAGWLLVRPLLRRFRVFQRAFHRLGQGDLQHRLDDARRDELGQLAADFNTMAARLQVLTAELERSDRQRRQLLSEVSHELGAPLTNVIGYLDLLRSRPGLDEDSRRSLRLCMAQARRLDRLVADLLDLARLDDAGLRLVMRPLDLRDIVDQEIAAIELACLDRGINVQWRRPGEPAPVLGDETRLAQVLRNLLRNAVHQLGGRDEGGELCVTLRREPRIIVLEVEDNGPGIRPGDLELLFERYHRPHTALGEGSGLGLCISRRLAELHQGTLDGASAGLGHGATFTLRLPGA